MAPSKVGAESIDLPLTSSVTEGKVIAPIWPELALGRKVTLSVKMYSLTWMEARRHQNIVERNSRRGAGPM